MRGPVFEARPGLTGMWQILQAGQEAESVPA